MLLIESAFALPGVVIFMTLGTSLLLTLGVRRGN